jgi:hypothetical protein
MSIQVTEDWVNVFVRVRNFGLLIGEDPRDEDMTLSRVRSQNSGTIFF